MEAEEIACLISYLQVLSRAEACLCILIEGGITTVDGFEEYVLL